MSNKDESTFNNFSGYMRRDLQVSLETVSKKLCGAVNFRG